MSCIVSGIVSGTKQRSTRVLTVPCIVSGIIQCSVGYLLLTVPCIVCGIVSGTIQCSVVSTYRAMYCVWYCVEDNTV